MPFLQDIKAAAEVFGEMRRARKEYDGNVRVRISYSVPFVNFGPAYYNTIEGRKIHELGRETEDAVMWGILPSDVLLSSWVPVRCYLRKYFGARQ